MNKTLLPAKVMHARQRPKKHVFHYGVYYLCVALDQIDTLTSKTFSVDKWNLFSFHRKDHGPRDGSDLKNWITDILKSHNLTEADGKIFLLTLPRILGYVFNPVSFWFCFDKHDQLRAVLSEVSNTFGEHHSYLSYHDDHRPIVAEEWLKAEKLFHVSPFLPIKGHYLFRFAYNEAHVAVNVNYFDAEGLMLATSVGGKRDALTDRNLIHCFLRYPLVTLKVIGLIHAEALRLLLKGARYHAKPLPPTIEVSR